MSTVFWMLVSIAANGAVAPVQYYEVEGDCEATKQAIYLRSKTKTELICVPYRASKLK